MENQSLIQNQKTLISLGAQQSLKVLQMGIEELNNWVEEKVTGNPLLEWPSHWKTPCIDTEIAHLPSRFEFLMEQAHGIFTKEKELSLAEWIIGNLDDTGFYTLGIEELPKEFTKEELNFCLTRIQEFDPPGIGARSLQESLLIQLKSLGKEKQLSFSIIENHFEELLKGELVFIQKKLGIQEDLLKKTLRSDISSLCPFPGKHFGHSSYPISSTDILLLEENGKLMIQIETPAYPTLKEVSLKDYGKEDKEIIKNYRKEGSWILNALNKRKETLEKIMKYLIKKQGAYILGERETLLPLSIQEASAELGLHESTITRAIANKNFSSPLGIIPLKGLFSKSLSETISYDTAQKLLRKLIAEEDKNKPLSDRELLEKMQQMGIPCARRTITKYRKQLNIPSKKERKPNF